MKVDEGNKGMRRNKNKLLNFKLQNSNVNSNPKSKIQKFYYLTFKLWISIDIWALIFGFNRKGSKRDQKKLKIRLINPAGFLIIKKRTCDKVRYYSW